MKRINNNFKQCHNCNKVDILNKICLCCCQKWICIDCCQKCDGCHKYIADTKCCKYIHRSTSSAKDLIVNKMVRCDLCTAKLCANCAKTYYIRDSQSFVEIYKNINICASYCYSADNNDLRISCKKCGINFCMYCNKNTFLISKKICNVECRLRHDFTTNQFDPLTGFTNVPPQYKYLLPGNYDELCKTCQN